MKLNLFGHFGYERGTRESQRLMLLFTRGNNWRELWKTGVVFRNEHGCVCGFSDTRNPGTLCQVYLQAPFDYQQRVNSSHPMLYLCDNGGELNIGWVNLEETHRSIPYTGNRGDANAETMFYRILTVLDGEEPDWNKFEEAFSDDDFAALVGQQ